MSEKPKMTREEKALLFSPKNKNKFIFWINKFKKPNDKEPGLRGYYTDKDGNIHSCQFWKNVKPKKDDLGNVLKDKETGKIITKTSFSGHLEDLGLKQNIVELKPKEPKSDEELDDDIPF
tara:strand:- start:76 stop:435 length:360 start_codon:yes stop_codon:yes gene_type:complete